jgi:hypothetical protein
MHTIAIECSDTAYSHIVYMVEHVLKNEAHIIDDNRHEPNEESKKVFLEVREGKNVEDFDFRELKR